MKSYLDILNDLMEALESDTAMPKKEKDAIKRTVQKLMARLWRYSY